MILSDTAIRRYLKTGAIVIEPFDDACLGSNSYDVHLGSTLQVYQNRILDAKEKNATDTIEIPESGYLLVPETLYLGVTMEYTETHLHVPFLEGKSSLGRLGISIHETAGKGDVGYCNTWTLELSVIQPVRVYAGMPIGQLIFFSVEGVVETPYNEKVSAKYNGTERIPVASKLYQDKFFRLRA